MNLVVEKREKMATSRKKAPSKPVSGHTSTSSHPQVTPSSRCTALTTSGQPCRARAVPGMRVCRAHGGGTSASRKKHPSSLQTRPSFWVSSAPASRLSLQEELENLLKQKLADISAIRHELCDHPEEYQGVVMDTLRTTSTGHGADSTTITYRQGFHPLVDELHKSEAEALSLIRTLQSLFTESSPEDTTRLVRQSVQHAARLMRAYPGMNIDDVSREVTRAL